jgi:acid phosphatase type 7
MTRRAISTTGGASRVRLGVSLFVGLGCLVGAHDAVAAAAITKGPWVQRVSADSAVVRVEVDPPAPVTLELGLGAATEDAGQRLVESAESRSLHTIVLNDLKPASRYAYSVRVGTTSKPAAFVTAPPDDGDTPFRFLVYGDNRTDAAAHAAVVRAMVPMGADFLVHTGDFVENGASAAQWQTFFDIEAPLLGARCVFSCVGNHELTDGSGIQYTRFFGPTDAPPGNGAVRPEHLNGTSRWGNARFFFINGMVSYKDSVDRTWLEKELGDADEEKGLRWRIVVVHHGPWSSGPHGNNARLHDAGIVPLLQAHKVDLILSGHDHIYERGWADGLAYVVSGGGGAPVYKIKSQLPTARKVESVRHFVDVRVNASSLQLVATRSDGSTIERCALDKAALGWDCDGVAAESPSGGARASSSTPTSGTGRALSNSHCACDSIGRSSARSSVLLSLGAVAATTLAFARRRRRAR